MAAHLKNATVFKSTSKTVQNELLDAMYAVYLDEITKEIDQANFISIQADETTDVACKCQVVIILRYLVKGEIKERFIAFEEAKEKNAEALTKILLTALEKYKVKDKLISQTYDGAATMSGRVKGVQTQIRATYPHAHFVHCYAHQLNLIMEQACSKHSRTCKVFFANLSAFPAFFSLSSKRTAGLKQYCNRRIPRGVATRWNFNSRTVNSVFENKNALLQFLLSVRDGYPDETSEGSSLDEPLEMAIDQDQDSNKEENTGRSSLGEPSEMGIDQDSGSEFTKFEWDAKTISEAAGLIKWLEDDEFSFLFDFFQRVMPHN